MAGEAARVDGLKGDPFSKGAFHVPHSVQAEQALLGAILVNNRVYDELHGLLKPEHFYVPMHAAVFEAAATVIDGRGGEANPITVAERLKGTSFDAEQKVFPHLTMIFENASLAADAKSLSEVILTAYRQRQLMGLAESVHLNARGSSRPEDVEAVLESAGSEIFRLSEAGAKQGGAQDMRSSLIEVIELAAEAKASGGGLTGVTTGFLDLDRLLSGFQRGDLIILGARPSMGKTSLLLNMAYAAAERHARKEPNSAPVAVFSLEMARRDLTQRMLAAEVGISAQRLANGQLSETEMQKLVGAATRLQVLPLFIDDTPALTVAGLRARARQLKRAHNIGLIVVDYLQLMTAPIRGDYSRVQEISLISQGLKQVARELDVPVIAASQLSRQVDGRDNKRPLLSDLRDSGSIEQDADVVLLLYRAEYYLSRALGAGDAVATDADRKRLADAQKLLEEARGITEVLVSKNRKGPTDTVKLLFEGETTTFRNMDMGRRA